MKNNYMQNDGIHELFFNAVHKAVQYRVPNISTEHIEKYLTSLMINFLHTDNIFKLKDESGKPISSVSEMVQEGDVILNAESFETERKVHKHIGDYILFWSAFYPEFLSLLKSKHITDTIINYTDQGRKSYDVASTFDHAPYTEEAQIFKNLSNHFEDYQDCLSIAKNNLPNWC